MGGIGDWAAELLIILSSFFFSFLFCLTFFWSCSNCEQPVVRARLEQTEARGQQCVLTASTERQINGERGSYTQSSLLQNWTATLDYSTDAVTGTTGRRCRFTNYKYCMFKLQHYLGNCGFWGCKRTKFQLILKVHVLGFCNTLSTPETQLNFSCCLFTVAKIFSCEHAHQQNANLLTKYNL